MPADGIQVLKWPWSLYNPEDQCVPLGTSASIVPYTGTALLACPRGTQIAPLGGSSDLSQLSQGATWDIYELPQSNVDVSDSSVLVYGEKSHWEIRYTAACHRFEVNSEGIEVETAQSLAVLDWWANFDDVKQLANSRDGYVTWDRVVTWLGLEEEEEDDAEPRRALISDIAERFSRTILENARHLRRILLRDHGLVPVHEIRQFDDRSMRWYVRQPGETLAEKAGPEQQIYSVIREETFDTLENRVFKDFLTRSIKAANRYVSQFEGEFPNSSRVREVKKYQYLCHQSRALPDFERVKKPLPGVQANYVLQSDERYRKVWIWYQKLLRDQDSEEEVWNWQGRLWADVCRLLTGAAIHYFSPGSSNYPEPRAFVHSSFKVSEQSRLGSRLLGTWGPGPRLVGQNGRYRGVLSVVDATEVRDHPIVRYCDGLGAQAYLIQEKVGTDTGKIKIAVMWTVNTLATFNEVDVPAASNSALRALRNAQEVLSSKTRLSVQLSGLILTNHQGTTPSQEALHYEQNDVAISYIDIGSDESCWSGAVQLIAERLESWF